MSTDMIPVRYIGYKPRKEDSVCRSGIIWEGPGDVRLVPPPVAAKLSQHPSVWEVGGTEPTDPRIAAETFAAAAADPFFKEAFEDRLSKSLADFVASLGWATDEELVATGDREAAGQGRIEYLRALCQELDDREASAERDPAKNTAFFSLLDQHWATVAAWIPYLTEEERDLLLQQEDLGRARVAIMDRLKTGKGMW